MATQPIGESGATYTESRVLREVALRTVSVPELATIPSILAVGALRPMAAFGSQVGGAIVRVEAERPLSPPFVAYVGSSLLSLLNLRLLSAPFDAYARAGLARSNARRPFSQGYLLALPLPPPPPVDTTAPVVGNFSPPAGTPIAKLTPITFEVTEDSGDFQRIFVVAFFPTTGLVEVIHDGDGFRGFYAANSARAMIAGGFRYTVLRSGGWLGAPTIQTFAVDRSGNEAT